MMRLAWLVKLVAFVIVTASAEESATDYRLERQSDPNIFGVASVARVTSRNGRISTTGGIHFYPGPNRANVYNPTAFTKAIDGKYATGSVQIHPGALGVSASAQAGYIDPAYWPIDLTRHWPQWPIQSQYTFDPWTKRVELPQARMQQWVYPSLNPFFNFWR